MTDSRGAVYTKIETSSLHCSKQVLCLSLIASRAIIKLS